MNRSCAFSKATAEAQLSPTSALRSNTFPQARQRSAILQPRLLARMVSAGGGAVRTMRLCATKEEHKQYEGKTVKTQTPLEAKASGPPERGTGPGGEVHLCRSRIGQPSDGGPWAARGCPDLAGVARRSGAESRVSGPALRRASGAPATAALSRGHGKGQNGRAGGARGAVRARTPLRARSRGGKRPFVERASSPGGRYPAVLGRDGSSVTDPSGLPRRPLPRRGRRGVGGR